MSMTILDALQWAKIQLSAFAATQPDGFVNTALEAQALLANASGKTKTQLIVAIDETLPNAIADTFIHLVKRRTEGEPISHILGTQPFFGRDFYVNRHVLTPRPETEELAEMLLRDIRKGDFLLEIGTGSGMLATTLALETDEPVIGTEIDAHSLRLARRNRDLHAANQLTLLHGSLLEPILARGSFSEFRRGVIAANLPYLPFHLSKTMTDDVLRFEPHHALFSGIDGLNHYHDLFRQIAANQSYLPRELHIYIEYHPDQTNSLLLLLKNILPRAEAEVRKDLSLRDRFLLIKAW
ncbi:MAG: peptide chain release factor N(5)-glutamine methyltransferase [bacterium]|nr:peptide chain release factor N(5)-glutamine methyltransferase [bacterium]